MNKRELEGTALDALQDAIRFVARDEGIPEDEVTKEQVDLLDLAGSLVPVYRAKLFDLATDSYEFRVVREESGVWDTVDMVIASNVEDYLVRFLGEHWPNQEEKFEDFVDEFVCFG